MVFYTSEVYLGDDGKLKELNRPFGSVIEMDTHIIKEWNKVVMPYDTVYILGGLGVSSRITELSGEKVLIMGKYDMRLFRKWVKESKYDDNFEMNSENYEEWMRNCTGVKRLSFNKRVTSFIGTDAVKLMTSREFETPKMFSVFGEEGNLDRAINFGINASLDVNGMRPLSEKDIKYYMEKINERKSSP